MAQKTKALVLATGNSGKVRELSVLFGNAPFELQSLRDFPHIRNVDETGSTFHENACIKARGFALQTRQLSLADDSGLEVEALGNAPGVLSARFGGADADYDVKISKLLAMLDATGDTDRRARFVCVMALADGSGTVIHTAEGLCRGTIARLPRGAAGFGYDPIFVPEGFDSTFAELGDDVKHRIGHRARAAALIIRYLLDFTGV